MPPNKPQSNYSKGPVSRVRLLKIGPRTTKSLFEEYFYGFAVMISLAVTILGKAGGLSSYDAVVTGLWAGGFTWFAWQVRRYRKERASPGSTEKSRQAVQAPPQMMKQPLPPNMKPMIGPQWPLKTLPSARKSVKRLVKPRGHRAIRISPRSCTSGLRCRTESRNCRITGRDDRAKSQNDETTD